MSSGREVWAAYEAVSVSATPRRPVAVRRPQSGLDTRWGRLASPHFLASPRAVFAQADLKNHQQDGSTEPDRHQGDGEHLAGQDAEHGGAHRTRDDQRGR
jgi:hypothetical protein